MKLALMIAASLAFAIPSSASAVTFDAFASFTGSNYPASSFFYGSGGVALVTPALPCLSGFSGVTCLQTGAGSDGPGFYKFTDPLTLSTEGGVNNLHIVNDALIVSPDSGAGVFFVAPTAGNYFVSALFNSIDDLATGVTITGVRSLNNVLTFNAIGPANSTASRSYSGTVFLAAGDVYGFSFGPGLVSDHDATSFKFSVSSAVPEPATWATMLLGLVVIGRLARRRPTLVSRPA